MMLFSLKNSKLKVMRKSQEGMASIVVVSILVIIMTLISIGFARLMNRTLNSSANRQFSTQATYAAQSGINDVASYLKNYVDTNPGYTSLPYSNKCNGAGSLIGSTATPGPFYNDSNLSGDTKYTCILLDAQPKVLSYDQVLPGKSQVVKLTTSAFPGSLDKVMVSWQAPPSTGLSSYPPDCPGSPSPCTSANLLDITTWNDNSHQYVPMLRLTIYPVPSYSPAPSAGAANLQANSKTVFLYPESNSGNVPVNDYSSIKDGSIIPVHCTTTVGNTAGVPDFNDTADYKCNMILSNFSQYFTAPDKLDYVYLRMTPIYNQANIELKANDQWGQKVNFINVQAVIDVTAQTGSVAKRLKAAVDTSSLNTTNSGIDTSISSQTDSMPEQSIRSDNAICKRVVLTTDPSTFSSISFDDSNSVCHDTSAVAVSEPPPTLAYSINGALADASDGVHSSDNTPASSAYYGVSYIGAGGSAALHWQSVHARTCTAGGGWSGNPSYSSFDAPSETGIGSQTFSGITDVTSYSLYCTRVDASGPISTATQTLTAWPPPTVSLSYPDNINAATPFDISWNVNNASSCTFTGNWSDTSSVSYPNGAPGTGTKTNNTAWNDNSPKTYTITCSDPSGRTATDTKTYPPAPRDCMVLGTCPSGTERGPICNATINIADNGDTTGDYQWDGSCTNVPIASSYFMLSTTDDSGGGDYGSGDPSKGCWVANAGNQPDDSSASCSDGGSYLTPMTSAGHYCAGFRTGVDPWGWTAQNRNCGDVIKPWVVINSFDDASGPSPNTVLAWDNSPYCTGNSGKGWDKTWWCRDATALGPPRPWSGYWTGDTNIWPICANGIHRWTICNVSWSASTSVPAYTAMITCKASTTFGEFTSGGPSGWTGPWGWDKGGGGGPNYTFVLACTYPGAPNTAYAYGGG